MFQKKVIAHLLKMINCTIHPQALLVLQSTGGGKSAIPQTAAVTDGGVTIILKNTLALSTDQRSKIKQLNSNKMFLFHLNSVKSKADKELLSMCLIPVLECDDQISVLLFTSPECIVDEIWINMIKKLLDSNFLKLVCIDKVHRFVEFGLTFRKLFATLKEKFFKLLVNLDYNKDSNSSVYTVLKIPILFMTATMNQY
jgi:superfamily II DNA helicase RecQ